MRTSWRVLVGAWALCFWPLTVTADPPAPPAQNLPAPVDLSNHGVVLPPQTFDDTAKAPNTTRDRTGQWTITGGAYLMQPVFNSNPAFVVNSASGNVSRQVDFGHPLQAAPQVWLGYVSERGWGARGRWFMFDHDSSAGYSTLPGESVRGASFLGLGQTGVAGNVVASSELALNVADFQATYSYDCAKWSLLAGFGVRYTHLSQDYRATLTALGTRIDLVSGHNFNGAGPSFSLETKRYLGEKGFAIYGNMHGAVQFGTVNETYTALNNAVYQEFTRSRTNVLPVGELEIGGEYARNMGRAKLFLQGGFVGQVWWNAGSASNVDPIGPTSASSHNLGLLGIALRAGVRY